MSDAIEQQGTLAARLWIYQAERFPLLKTAVLLAAFSAASINVSAFLSGRSLPGAATYVVAFVVLFVIFFQLRAFDELKDADDDRRYRPERPIPRGLVSLRFVLRLAAALVPIAIAASWALSPWLLLPLAGVWAWLALMTAEFGVPDWLKARPMLYLVSHMLIMPLIDLYVTATEWLVRHGSPPSALWLFLALSFANGCVLEIGRKLYAPESERPGVETYSSLLGVRKAALLWIACLCLSFALLVGVGLMVGAPTPIALVGAFALAAVVAIAWRFIDAPTVASQKLVDTAAGLWVFVCYMASGFIPLVAAGS